MLTERIGRKEAKLAVIGLGYVGLPLLVEYANAGYSAVGIDVDTEKVSRVLRADSYIRDVSSAALSACIDSGRLKATTDFSVLAESDTVNICVPTPLRKTRDPDISYIVAAVEEIAKYIRKGQLIVLESTTYPGTTEEVILPMLEKTGLKVGTDFFLAFSPERVDPGNAKFNTKNIPKVIGGITSACTQAAAALYGATLSTIVPVSSAKAAETVKLLENTFRSVNIGLVNEIALMCDRMGIDVWEVIDAAATKPFGFMPFYPGPGLGGHCIPIDPFYLSWKAKQAGFEARFIELAGQINGSMPEHVVTKIADVLNEKQKSVNGSNILILGVTYKQNIDDIRESPALDVMRLLAHKGARLSYHDPFVSDGEVDLKAFQRVALDASVLEASDCAVILTGHTTVDYDKVVEHASAIVDTRNVLKEIRSNKIVKL